MLNNSERTAYGQNGSDLITDTAVHTPPAGYRWMVLEVIADAVFTTLATSSLRLNGSAPEDGVFTNLSLAPGFYWGTFTSLKLASGVVQAYCDGSTAGGAGTLGQ